MFTTAQIYLELELQFCVELHVKNLDVACSCLSVCLSAVRMREVVGRGR